MWIDYNEGTLNFKRRGFMKQQYSMNLALEDKFIKKLKPFVSFEG